MSVQSDVNHYFKRNIIDLKNGVGSLNIRVDALDKKLKKGFATESALSGPFRPYGIGRINTPFSVGGYENENAVAIGNRYRFNQKMAFKAGLATNTDNVKRAAYNAAINMEW